MYLQLQFRDGANYLHQLFYVIVLKTIQNKRSKTGIGYSVSISE